MTGPVGCYGSYECCPVGVTGGSLPCGRHLLAPLTGNKEGSQNLMVLRVRPRFSKSIPYTLVDRVGVGFCRSSCFKKIWLDIKRFRIWNSVIALVRNVAKSSGWRNMRGSGVGISWNVKLKFSSFILKHFKPIMEGGCYFWKEMHAEKY